MTHRARVLQIGERDGLVAEMEAIGVDNVATGWLADRGRLLPVRLEDVDGRAAALLKQQMLALGADCAVHRGVAGFESEPRAAVLLGDVRTYRRLMERLEQQPFGLAELAQEVLRAIEAFEARSRELDCAGLKLPLGERTLVMGIINLGPDSFSGDGLDGNLEDAIEQARGFVEAGADIIDVGGESTRPGSEPVGVDEELERALPVVAEIAEEFETVISIDTSKPEVAEMAVAAGARMINDVTGLGSAQMVDCVARSGVAACAMHMKGTPREMQQDPAYEDMMSEVYGLLASRIDAAVAAGVERDRLLVDPGFGFGKTVDQNLEMLARLREFRSLGVGVMIGTSRKSTIGKVLDRPVEERLMGTAATCAIAIANGADIIRVHDVAEMAQVARMTDAIVRGWQDEP